MGWLSIIKERRGKNRQILSLYEPLIDLCVLALEPFAVCCTRHRTRMNTDLTDFHGCGIRAYQYHPCAPCSITKSIAVFRYLAPQIYHFSNINFRRRYATETARHLNQRIYQYRESINLRMRPCICGSEEFVTQPNRYDVYQIIDGRLEYQRSESVDDGLTVYCRECGKRYEK